MLVGAAKIRRANETNSEALKLRPSDGLGTSITSATVVDGFRCEIAEGQWKLHTDLPESEGGKQWPIPRRSRSRGARQLPCDGNCHPSCQNARGVGQSHG